MNWLIAHRTAVIRGLAWFGILAVVILSVVPATERPVTGAGQEFEHFVYRTRFFGHKFELSGLLHAGLLPDGAGLARTA